MTDIRRLFLEPTAFQDHKVLKNGSSLVLRLETGGRRVVCKIAHANNALLEREAARVQLLKARYPILGGRIPAVLGQGVIAGGLHRDKTYYLQDYVEGETLAQTLQAGGLDRDAAAAILGTVVSALLDTVDEHEFDAGLDRRSGTWMREYIGEAYHRLLGLEHIGYLTSLDEIVINGRPRRSLARCLDEIFASPALARLDAAPSSISVLGHWNFHADNVLIEPGDGASGFKVIDPDVRIEVNDPLFGLARLFYSFPHDSAEGEGYRIETDVLLPNAADGRHFDVAFTWPPAVIDTYRPLFAGIAADGAYDPAALDSRLADPAWAARLDLCLLLCLLRGTAINHETAFWVLDDNLRAFRNKGVLLFLSVVDFANTVADRFRGLA